MCVYTHAHTHKPEGQFTSDSLVYCASDMHVPQAAAVFTLHSVARRTRFGRADAMWQSMRYDRYSAWQGNQSHGSHDDRIYHRNQIARQLFSVEEYRVMKRFCGWKLDAWNRDKLVSYVCCQYLRHVKDGIMLRSDGSFSIRRLCSLPALYIQRVSPSELKDFILQCESDLNGKRR